MASIDEYLEQILEARYGRDVRQSIHDGIKKCYEDGRAQPSSWGTLDGKPFEGIGTGLSVDQEGNLNAEGGAIPDNVAYLGEETIPSTPTPRDADTLQGHNADYFVPISDLNSFISIFYKTAETVTIEGNKATPTLSIDMTKEGYSLIGVSGYNTGNQEKFVVSQMRPSGQNIQFSIRNLTSTTQNCTPVFYGLYRKVL